MKINIIYHDNSYGLTKDASLIADILKGHTINYIDIYKKENLNKADLNIFLEVLDANDKYFDLYFNLASRNIYIPNPEWTGKHWIKHLDLFDAVCCKTQHGLKVFSELCSKTVFTSFTAYDQKIKVSKKYNAFFHSAGKSQNKGTAKLVEAWTKIPYYLLLLRKGEQTNNKYIKVINKFISDEEFVKYKNEFMFHIYPTRYEGFGHNIWESMSIGAVILTTDAPPMNEYVNDFNFDCYKSREHGLVRFNEVYIESIQEQCREVMSLTQLEIKRIMNKNIEKFWDNDKFFRSKLLEICQ